MKTDAVTARLPVYGMTLTNSFDGLLDDRIAMSLRCKEAIKQLRKIAFSYPNVSQQVDAVVHILEGKS